MKGEEKETDYIDGLLARYSKIIDAIDAGFPGFERQFNDYMQSLTEIYTRYTDRLEEFNRSGQSPDAFRDFMGAVAPSKGEVSELNSRLLRSLAIKKEIEGAIEEREAIRAELLAARPEWDAVHGMIETLMFLPEDRKADYRKKVKAELSGHGLVFFNGELGRYRQKLKERMEFDLRMLDIELQITLLHKYGLLHPDEITDIVTARG